MPTAYQPESGHVPSERFGKNPLPPWNAGIYDRAIQSLVLWARILYLIAVNVKACGQFSRYQKKQEIAILNVRSFLMNAIFFMM
jgi:hypothetical protein